MQKLIIEGDVRMNYYTNVKRFTYKYTSTIRATSSYIHYFNTVKIQELVRFDGILVRDGVLDSTNSMLYRK